MAKKMIIRARSFEKWMQANFTRGELQDLARYGANTGWQGLTYYNDTVALYDKFNVEIWTALYEDAESFGAKNAIAFIADFGGADSVSDDDTFKNLLVWYMAERTAHELLGDDY
jgi:hypothetical protein